MNLISNGISFLRENESLKLREGEWGGGGAGRGRGRRVWPDTSQCVPSFVDCLVPL